MWMDLGLVVSLGHTVGICDFLSPTLPCSASTKLESSPVLSPGNKAKPEDHRSRPGRPAVSDLGQDVKD